jgi:hypothetical protein
MLPPPPHRGRRALRTRVVGSFQPRSIVESARWRIAGDLAQALGLAIYEHDRHGLSTSGPEAVGFGSGDHLPPTWLPDEERRVFTGMDYTPILYNHPL